LSVHTPTHCSPPYVQAIETRQITTDNYISEAVKRHRQTDESLLKEYLKVRERDVNKEWDKPGRPGPKVQLQRI
jgi:hypothetical protein